MAQLQIYRQGEKVLSFILDKNLVRLGRASPSEIELPDPSLSREHCLLVRKENQWFLEDCSKNGVFLDSGAQVEGRARLEPNQKYKIGRLYAFEFEPKLTTADSKEKTLLLSNSPTQLISIDKAGKKIVVGKGELRGTNSEGAAFRKEIPADGLSIGSHSENDIILEADAVSQFHARIDFVDNAYVLSDLSSTNGSFIHGVRILKAPVSDQGKIQIGPFELVLNVRKEEHAIEPKASNRLLDMVSQNKQMKTVFSTIEVVASTEAAVVIHGETGTGKELVAKALHDLSRRCAHPFVAINCAALPKDLVESELFGHEKGSFTGASSTQIGAFESAHQGSLFLDEIAELDLSIQAKLLRALESKEIKRLGATKSVPISVRLVSASHKNLLEEVRKGLFREDLFYRLQVIEVSLPPLRERLDDIELLTTELLRQLKLDLTLNEKAVSLLQSYSFPGNIRELKNILQRAAIEHEMRAMHEESSADSVLTDKDFHFLGENPDRLLNAKQRAEKDRIKKALRKFDFIQTDAAKFLRLPLSTMHDKVKRYGLQ